MDISEANWKKTRHESAKAAGVAEAAKKWNAKCLAPEKLDDESAKVAVSVAEELRAALKKALSQLEVEPKVQKAYNDLQKENPKDDKGKKKLAEAKKAVDDANAKIKATRELAKDWDDQATKYSRSVLKADDERKKQLENHKKEVQGVLEMFKSLSRTCTLGQKRLEEAMRNLSGYSLKAEKELSNAMNAKKTANGFAFNVIKKNHAQITADAKKEFLDAKKEVQTIIAQVKKSFPSVKPLVEHSLTNKKLQDQLRKDSDRVDGEFGVLSESLPKLDDAADEIKMLLAKIETAMTDGLDEVAEIKDQLLRTLKRGSEQLRQVKSIVELGIGALLEQANLEIINLVENRPKTSEERTKVWETADAFLQRAANNMNNADSTLDRVQKMFEQVRAAIPDPVQKNPSGELAPLIKELGLQEGDLDKYARAHDENKVNLEKRRKKLQSLPKTV